MQILGTSDMIQQCFGVSDTNANIRYIRRYTTIFGYIREKNTNMRYIRRYHHILGEPENNTNIEYIEENSIIGSSTTKTNIRHIKVCT